MFETPIVDFRLGAERILACDIQVSRSPGQPHWLTIEARGRRLSVSWDAERGFGFGSQPACANPSVFLRNVDDAIRKAGDLLRSPAVKLAA